MMQELPADEKDSSTREHLAAGNLMAGAFQALLAEHEHGKLANAALVALRFDDENLQQTSIDRATLKFIPLKKL